MQLVRKNELLSFFVLSFTFSYVIWFLIPLLWGSDAELQRISNMVGAFGPSLAAITTAALSPSRKEKIVNTKALWALYPVIFIIALASAEIFFIASYRPETIIFISVIAFVAALIISSAFSKHTAIESLMGSLVNWRLKSRWYVFALCFFPGAGLVSMLAALMLRSEVVPFFKQYIWYQYIYLIPLIFMAAFLFGGSINEEAGWRGYALPRLLTKFSPITATLILGFIWSLWHAPLHFNGFYSPAGIVPFLSRFIYNVPITFFFTWLYLHTKGNLLMANLLHTSFNVTFIIFPLSGLSGNFLVLLLLAGLVVIIADPIWRAKQETLQKDMRQ